MGFVEVNVHFQAGYVQDITSIERTGGRVIDWANVPSTFADTDGVKRILGGTIMVKQADGTIIPRAGAAGGATATEILLELQEEGSRTASLTGCNTILGGVLFEEELPDYSEAGFATWKGELASAGCTFKYVSSNNSNLTPAGS